MSNVQRYMRNVQRYKNFIRGQNEKREQNFTPLNSFSAPPPPNYPLKRLNALTPSITSKAKKIGQSSKQPGEVNSLNRIIHNIGGKRKTYKRKTRKHRVRKH